MPFGGVPKVGTLKVETCCAVCKTSSLDHHVGLCFKLLMMS